MQNGVYRANRVLNALRRRPCFEHSGSQVLVNFLGLAV